MANRPGTGMGSSETSGDFQIRIKETTRFPIAKHLHGTGKAYLQVSTRFLKHVNLHATYIDNDLKIYSFSINKEIHIYTNSCVHIGI